MLIAVCCDRGSPGSTIETLALGVSTPEPTIVVEADPSGGDLALRCTALGGRGERFPPTPTVLTLASEARMSATPMLAASRAQEFTTSTRVVPGHMAAEQAAGVKNWAPLAEALRISTPRVVADLGRIHSSSPSIPIAAAADVVVMVTRPEMGAVMHLKDRLERLAPVLANIRNAPPVVIPVVVAPKRIASTVVAHIERILMPSSAAGVVAGVGWIAFDPAGVETLLAGQVEGRRGRTPLLRSASVLNDQINRAVGIGPYDGSADAMVDAPTEGGGEA